MGIRGQQPIYTPRELINKIIEYKQADKDRSVMRMCKWIKISRRTLLNYSHDVNYAHAFVLVENEIRRV